MQAGTVGAVYVDRPETSQVMVSIVVVVVVMAIPNGMALHPTLATYTALPASHIQRWPLLAGARKAHGAAPTLTYIYTYTVGYELPMCRAPLPGIQRDPRTPGLAVLMRVRNCWPGWNCLSVLEPVPMPVPVPVPVPVRAPLCFTLYTYNLLTTAAPPTHAQSVYRYKHVQVVVPNYLPRYASKYILE